MTGFLMAKEDGHLTIPFCFNYQVLRPVWPLRVRPCALCRIREMRMISVKMAALLHRLRL